MGFQEGNLLEPSCGIGNFIGMLPKSMENAKVYGVELDTISAGIAQQLYQKSSIMDILSIGKNTAYALVNSGVFHFVKVGGHYRISKKSFDRWLDNMDSESSGCQLCD